MIAAIREVRARDMRSNFLPARACRDPEWPMLAYLATRHGFDVGTTELVAASYAPLATALRHIALLERDGLIERHKIESDARVTAIRLTQTGWDAMSAYFERIAA